MEGFLIKKSRGENSFGSRFLSDVSKNWKRRWFVLEEQVLIYYEDFDLVSEQPMVEKGALNIKDCEVLPVSHNTKKLLFCIRDKKTKTNVLYAQAEDAKSLGCKMQLQFSLQSILF